MTAVKEKKLNINNYDKSAEFHSNKFNEIGARVGDVDRTFALVDKTNPKVVEIGCGNGRDASYIVKHTKDYLGIDLSKEMLKLALKNNPGVNFQLADLETYDFPKGVDIVFSFASLLHTDAESLKEVIEKIYASLNQGGVFFLSLKMGEYHKEKVDRDGLGPRTFYFYNPEEIRKLSPNGLTVIYELPYEFKDQKWFSMILRKG